MKENQVAIYNAVLKHEGGYSNHLRDRGGPTNKGITQAVYDAWRSLKGLPARSVKLLEAAECEDIYDANYWERLRCDQLPSGIDYAVYDFGVNSGVSRAATFLQRLLIKRGFDLGPTKADGSIGLLTLRAVQGVNDRAQLIKELCNNRMIFLRKLNTWDDFGKGWTARVNQVRDAAVKLAG